MIINRNKPPSKKMLALRALVAEQVRKYEEEDRTEANLTDAQQRRRAEENAILVKPQPKSNGRIDGIEI
jgi:hypothetical protein